MGWVFLQNHEAVGFSPRCHDERARRDKRFHIGRTIIAQLVPDLHGHRIPQADNAGQIGFGGLGHDYNGLVIGGGYANRRHVGLAFGNGRPVLAAARIAPIPGEIIAGGGGTLQREDVVVGDQWRAVAPHQTITQMEGPGQAILGLLPLFGRHGVHLEILVETGQGKPE